MVRGALRGFLFLFLLFLVARLIGRSGRRPVRGQHNSGDRFNSFSYHFFVDRLALVGRPDVGTRPTLSSFPLRQHAFKNFIGAQIHGGNNICITQTN